jgi:hypothetical protein
VAETASSYPPLVARRPLEHTRGLTFIASIIPRSYALSDAARE